MTTFDFTPLEASPGLASPLVDRSSGTFPRAAYAFFVFIGCGGLFILMGSIPILFTAAREGWDAAAQPYLLAWATFGLVSGVTSLIVGVRWSKRVNSRVPSMLSRLTAFAEANGLTVQNSTDRLPPPGFHFALPMPALENNPALFTPTVRVHGYGDHPFIVGDHWQPATSMFTSTPIARRPFVAIKLDRRLPRIVLVPVGADSEFDLDADQQLKLEGDFNTYFRLYCPPEYRTDALVIFTPDVMAAMVDNAQAWSAEIVDDSLHFTRSGPTLEAGTVAEVRNAFELVSTAGRQVNEQAARYSDDRVGSKALNIIAERGRQLSTRKPVWKVAAAVGLVYAIVIAFVPGVSALILFS